MKRTDVTYGQLDKALRSMGFSYRLDETEPPARVYEHKESGAIVFFPPFPKNDCVFEYHLITVRKMLDEYGVADPTVFANELNRTG